MFLILDASYQLFRNKGRSLLLTCVSALLCGCVAFYMGNILSSQKALSTINQTTPAIVHITNQDADSIDNLTIPYTRADVLATTSLQKILATCQAGGAFSEEAQAEDPFNGGDTTIVGGTNLEALGIDSDKAFTYGEGYDSSLLDGNQGLCLLKEDYAQSHSLKVGDQIELPIHVVKYTSDRIPLYFFAGMGKLTVAGTFPANTKTSQPADMFVPVQWLREQFEANSGDPFAYNSFGGELADSMNLNDFKASLDELGFTQPFKTQNFSEWGDWYDASEGAAIMMDDEDFIKTAEKLGETIQQFQIFLLPFFGVVVGLVTLSIFLVLRGARRDMAISCSLGRPKGLIGAANLLAALGAELIGSLLVLPVMILLLGIPSGTALVVCLAFLACALVGDLAALCLLLRFDALSMLTASQE